MSKAININAIVTTYAKFLTAGASYGAALSEAAAILKGSPCPELLQGLATVHAKHFQCNVSWSASGSAVFHTGPESTRETRHTAAAMSWSRNVATHFKAPTTRQHKPVDAVAKLAKAYAELTAAQKKRFLAML